jgi:hypothetical protein
MRLLIILFLSALVSCKPKIDTSKLRGSWTIDQDESKYPKAGSVDKLTFYPNDSLTIEMIIDGKLNQFFSGKYKIDKERNVIITRVDTVEVQSEIVSLSERKLVLKDHKRKITTKYKRL